MAGAAVRAPSSTVAAAIAGEKRLVEAHSRGTLKLHAAARFPVCWASA